MLDNFMLPLVSQCDSDE